MTGREDREGWAEYLHIPSGSRAQHHIEMAPSRTLRHAALAVWLAGGGLWVLLTLVLMLADPSGDVARGPHTVLFLVSAVVWSLLDLPVLKLSRRRDRAEE